MEIETREVLERETSNEKFENIGIPLDKTQLDNNQMTRSMHSSKNIEKHKPEVNPDPEPSSSDYSESLSSDLRVKKKKRTKKKSVVSIKNMTRQTHLRAMILIPPMTVIIYVSDANIRSIRKMYPIRLCATLTSKLLTTAYKSKIIRFKMDEDPLQRQIYFLAFIDSLDMIFHSTEKLVKFF